MNDELKFRIYKIEWLEPISENHVARTNLPNETTVEIFDYGLGWFETEMEYRQYVREAIGNELTSRYGWEIGGYWFDPA